MWVANLHVFVQLTSGVAALWVIAVSSITVYSAFGEYTGPADDLFAPAEAAAHN